jgi:dienelactone hydrolase
MVPLHLVAAFLLLAQDPQAGSMAQSHPEAEEKELAPPLLWDDFGYGPGKRERIGRVVNPIKGNPPVAIFISGPGHVRRPSSYDTSWLGYFLFHHKFLPMSFWSTSYAQPTGAEHAARAAAAIAEIVRRAPDLGYDASRIVLVGNGWGGGTAALLGTDPSWLEAAGIPFASIRAVVILDGHGLDLATERAGADTWSARQIDKMLDGEPATRLSAQDHLAPPNAPRFLLYAPSDDPEARGRSERFVAGLRENGAIAEVRLAKRTRSRAWSTYPGQTRHPENEALARFLESATAR